jgi:hypothetical protein
MRCLARRSQDRPASADEPPATAPAASNKPGGRIITRPFNPMNVEEARIMSPPWPEYTDES